MIIIELSCAYLREYTFDTFQGPVLIASTEGGVNIEEIAESNPDAIQTFPIDIVSGLSKDMALEIAGKFPLSKDIFYERVLLLQADVTKVGLPFSIKKKFKKAKLLHKWVKLVFSKQKFC